MNVRSIHLDDHGNPAHVDVRLTIHEARLLADLCAGFASVLQGMPAMPSKDVPAPAAEVTPIAPAVRRRRRLTDRELAAAIDAILDREPTAGRPRIREELARRGFIAGNSTHLSRILKARKRARLRALSLPLDA